MRYRHFRPAFGFLYFKKNPKRRQRMFFALSPWLVDEELNGGIRWLLGAFTDNLHPLVDVGTAR